MFKLPYLLGPPVAPIADPADLGSEPSRAENSYHVVTARDTDETAVLDGIIVTAGNASDTYPNNNGGGMCCDYADPVLTNCTFKANSANGKGGGVHNYWSDLVMSGCALIGLIMNE